MNYARSPLVAVQSAVYDRVMGDHPDYLLSRYEPETNPGYPRAAFGAIDGVPHNTKSTLGYMLTWPIDIYSQSPGLTELEGLLNGYLESLTDRTRPLSVCDDWELVALEAPWTVTTEQRDDGVIQHATIRLSIEVEDAS